VFLPLFGFFIRQNVLVKALNLFYKEFLSSLHGIKAWQVLKNHKEFFLALISHGQYWALSFH
jgi:hypothetical protein